MNEGTGSAAGDAGVADLIDAGTWLPLDPPRPVIFIPAEAIGWAARLAGRRPPPLRVRSWGLTYPPELPATQTGWVRFCTGIWAATITVDLPTFNRRTHLTADLWVPADAIRLSATPAAQPGAADTTADDHRHAR
ncbi:hypothetical protein [Gordonia sihwensis]|uniref:hypothetical protein n=1 Tax=Gordonia sihwensis TaxID=173559 RepID=UPI0005F0AE09|nr:hypothetical protein [Gordonia sihwensis]KJR10534.1 hypothetical protein UG54_00625 [Gordonia sihwensis]